MTQDLLDPILAQTFTQAEALHRLSALKEAAVKKLFGSRQKPAGQEDPWLSSLDPDIYRHFTKENVYKIFDTVEAEIKNIKPLTLFLPFEIPNNEVANLGIYLRKSYGKNFLMEIKPDPSLIAGAALVWNGIYKDYSLRQRITDNRQKILDTMQEFIHK